jgi:hypothetical protein
MPLVTILISNIFQPSFFHIPNFSIVNKTIYEPFYEPVFSNEFIKVPRANFCCVQNNVFKLIRKYFERNTIQKRQKCGVGKSNLPHNSRSQMLV